jgi:toxin ParE1/3/4
VGECEAADRDRHSRPVTRTLRNLKAASKEFAAAVRWYEKQRPGLGGEFFDAVVHATSLIQAQPEIGTLSPDRRTRRVLVERFPYQVVYRLSADEIVIVAIAHTKRRPGYWRNRR